MARLLQRPLRLAILAAANFAAMVVLDACWFRPAAGGLASLDTRVTGFTTEDAFQWLTALGPQGREAIIVWHYLTFDLTFPALFSLAVAGFVLTYARRLDRFKSLPRRAQTLCALAVPLPYALADYGQNLLVVRMLAAPVDVSQALAAAASVLVILKFAFCIAALAIVAAAIMAARRTD
ncbi:MAG: hypothetical protein Q8Q62_02180 [Mesorhizobium sp.]|nr:hypothetical protein [Mesorhizobium sp.]